MKKGSKVVITQRICANGLKNPHYGKIGTILENPDRLDLVKISIDNFPNCNHREYHNQFYYDIEELKVI